jgi:two-component system response regulator VanR
MDMSKLEKLADLKILYIEDEEIVQKAISSILEDVVKDVILASDGKIALQKVAENPDISLIITDIQMPNMNGVEFSKEFRKSNQETPIIAITAFDNSTPILNSNAIGDDIGIDKYLQKPADVDAILDSIFEVLGI